MFHVPPWSAQNATQKELLFNVWSQPPTCFMSLTIIAARLTSFSSKFAELSCLANTMIRMFTLMQIRLWRLTQIYAATVSHLMTCVPPFHLCSHNVMRLLLLVTTMFTIMSKTSKHLWSHIYSNKFIEVCFFSKQEIFRLCCVVNTAFTQFFLFSMLHF